MPSGMERAPAEVRASKRNAVGSVCSGGAGPTWESWGQWEGGLRSRKVREVRPQLREKGCRAGKNVVLGHGFTILDQKPRNQAQKRTKLSTYKHKGIFRGKIV